MRQATNRFLERDKRRVTRDFTGCNIWKISGFSKSVVVFYLTENDVRTNAVNDTSNRITKRCYELVKQYDEFGYFQFDSFPITFDSKENLDKNFMGNLFYYFR